MHTTRTSACGNPLWGFTVKNLCEDVDSKIQCLAQQTPGSKDLPTQQIVAAHIQLQDYWQEARRDFLLHQPDRVCLTERGLEIALIPHQVALNKAKTEFAVLIKFVTD